MTPILIFIGIAALVIIVTIATKNKTTIKQNWGTNEIGLGAYPSKIDPEAHGVGTVWMYTPKTSTAQTATYDLVQKWFKFAEAVGPDISGAIYALFSDLQTPQSISYYGLSAGMVRVLYAIAPYLDSPGSVKTLSDVNRIFSPTAIRIFDQELNVKPQSGLYENEAAYGDYIDVL